MNDFVYLHHSTILYRNEILNLRSLIIAIYKMVEWRGIKGNHWGGGGGQVELLPVLARKVFIYT